MSPNLLKPEEIFSSLLENFPEEEAKDLIDYTVELLQSEFNLDEYESYRLAERHENHLRSIIDKYIEDCRIRNIVPKIVFSEYDVSRLVGRCFIYRTDSNETRRYKKKLLLVNEIRTCVENLSWGEFEILCTKLFALEPRMCQVRRRRRNGGIDFQARCQVSPTMRVSVAGQAKHYERNRKIGPHVIRELAGSMSNGPWAFGVIMTTAGFTPGARKVGGQKRIDCIDGEQIAFKIIETGFGIVENAEILFNESNFRRWLSS